MATRSITSRAASGAAAVLLMLGAIALAQDGRAQGERVPPRGEPPGGYQPVPPGPGGGFPGGGPMMRGPGGGGAIAVAGDSVYVLQGNSLYKFAAGDLALVKRVQLDPPPPPGGPRPERR